MHLHVLRGVGQGILNAIRCRGDLRHGTTGARSHIFVGRILLGVGLRILWETIVHRCAQEALRGRTVEDLRSTQISLGIL